MNVHENHMIRCLELAQMGAGRVSPNPMVGSVVLDKDGNVVGEGYHMKYGEAHAEVNALDMAGEKARGGTIYVSLEPCSHYGKTPPCVERIIKEGLSTLVVGMTDPNPLVAGRGIQRAKEAGITVIENVLEAQCLHVNEVFVKNITEKKSFVMVKTASTLDGKIATASGSSKWITSAAAREEVQSMRNFYDAILTGSQTVIADNPSLDCRMQGGRNPVRVVLDSQLKTPVGAKVYADNSTRVVVACVKAVSHKLYPAHVEIVECAPDSNGRVDLNSLMSVLYEKGLYSVMVEAGGTVNGSFLKQGLIDKVCMFVAPKILGDNTGKSCFDGLNAMSISDCKDFKIESVREFSPDVMFELYPVKNV